MAKINLPLISIGFLVLIGLTVTSAGPSPWRGKGNPTDLYGKPCLNGSSSEGSNLVACDTFRNMVCSNKGICECAPSAEFKETEYDKDALACFPVPTAKDEFRCQTDFQCKVSSYGQYSRCNFDDGHCVCHYETAQVELVEGVCYVVRPIPFGEDYPTCDNDSDCTGSTLGVLSRCNKASGRCDCYDTISSGKNEADYYEGECIYKRLLGQFCDKDAQCRLGYHHNAVCRESPAFLKGEKVCECENPGSCDSDNGSSRQVGSSNSVIMMGITTFILGLVATKIIN